MRTATITVTPETLRGNRIWLLYTVENDQEILLDAVLAPSKPTETGDEFYLVVNAMELAGIFNGYKAATLTFNEIRKLVSLQ